MNAVNLPPELAPLLSVIDQVLNQPPNAIAQSQVLGQVQQGLLALQSRLSQETTAAPSPGEAMLATQISQTVIQHLTFQTQEWLTPLRQEVTQLQQRKEQLQQELDQLHQEREQEKNHWLQEMKSQFRHLLQHELQQSLDSLETQLVYLYGSLQQQGPETTAPPVPPDSASSLRLSPLKTLQHLQNLQTETEQKVLKLDRHLGELFGTLEQNMYAYELALGDRLEKLYRLSNQGEILVKDYLNSLQSCLESAPPAPWNSTEAIAPYAGMEVKQPTFHSGALFSTDQFQHGALEEVMENEEEGEEPQIVPPTFTSAASLFTDDLGGDRPDLGEPAPDPTAELDTAEFAAALVEATTGSAAPIPEEPEIITSFADLFPPGELQLPEPSPEDLTSESAYGLRAPTDENLLEPDNSGAIAPNLGEDLPPETMAQMATDLKNFEGTAAPEATENTEDYEPPADPWQAPPS